MILENKLTDKICWSNITLKYNGEKRAMKLCNLGEYKCEYADKIIKVGSHAYLMCKYEGERK